MAGSKGALDGIFVLDLSRILAGPTCTQLLGDLGATVIKVEHPGTRGDDTRGWGPNYALDRDGNRTDLSAYFMAANRNKKSVALDIATPEGQAILHRMVTRADVVVENFKPGGLKKYGLDHATLRARHPGLVYCSISGFGQDGPNSARPGYDLMAQGFGGIMSITGEPDGAPMKVGVGIADVMCGMYAAIGILAALRHRDATGEGQHIDLALVDSAMAWLVNEGTNFLTSNTLPERRGNAHPNIVPYDAFECADGHILLAVGNDAQFARFCDTVGLAQEDRFSTNLRRIENRTALMAEIAPVLRNRQKAELLERLQAAGVPCGPINTISEALESSQAKARGAVVEIPAGDVAGGLVRLLGNPLKMSATPVRYDRPPPRFGQDTDEIIAEFGGDLLQD
ncbi:CoA transferase [Sulfitobacter alexandrii]|uniref:CoA transferase n=1 Tax=Sulfitobacter alexandrii TaxID=1917485 RepID=A0A1J0WE69_9RHOB|nr:CoA transferase [Sulfitobacter alexandrii]APE42604.1 CoA transferase [Sulfitobacter alexandrii]